MFRKLADRLSAGMNDAVSAVTGNTNNRNGNGNGNGNGGGGGGGGGNSGQQQQELQQLQAMGFDRTQAEQALQATNGNVEEAAELLLASSPPQQRQQQQQQQQHDNDDDLQRAMAASLQETQPQRRTAAMEKAAQAAQARHAPDNQKNKKKKTTTVTTQKTALQLSTARADLVKHHPGVQVVPKLQDKSVEEQIMRCADRLKRHPTAVDTLHKACVTIQSNMDEPKYRTLDTTNPGFQRSVHPAPGAYDFLRALQFQKVNETTWVLRQPDPARLYLGRSALEQAKLSDDYKTAKEEVVFQQEIQRLLSAANDNEQEAITRATYLAKCPAEPAQGRGAWMQVTLGITNDSPVLKRRFDADDTLMDVLHWLAAHLGQTLVHNLEETRLWNLQDTHRHPPHPLDFSQNWTLQYAGCWPSGRLRLTTSTEEWQRGQRSGPASSARGLGAAPKEALE